MVLRKIRKGKYKGWYGVYHCRKGKKILIKAFRTKEKALAMHTAIVMSKKRREKRR